jgi:carboxyl-terminal processing protease
MLTRVDSRGAQQPSRHTPALDDDNARRGSAHGFARGFGSGAVVGLVLGVCLSTSVAWARSDDSAYKPLRVFAQVLSYIQQSYVEPIDPTELVYNGVAGLLTGLDPYSTFLRPSEYERLREDTAGEFGGLGIELRPVDGDRGAVITVVHDNGPAANAGLQPADRVLAIDGEEVTDAPIDGVVRMMRGVPGSKIVLQVLRGTWPKPRDVVLVRKEVVVPSVRSQLLTSAVGAADVGYIAIASFQERTDNDFGVALRRLRNDADKHGHGFAGLVIDVRGNPGGLFDEGVKVADRFLRDGIIVSTEGRDPSTSSIERAHPDGTEPAYPVVVLVDGGTASASEILAGALQDQKRAVVVGEPSFGKGSVQSLFGLDEGAGLKLTVARYKTPSGRSIQGKGIIPDVPVKTTTAPTKGVRPLDTDAALAAAIQHFKTR